MKILLLLTMIMVLHSYEYVGIEQINMDIKHGIEIQNLDIPVTWFLKENIGKYPALDKSGGPQANIPVFLQYFDWLNQAFQTGAALATKDAKYNSIYPIYMITMIDCMARIQPDIKSFIDGFPKSDPSYPARIAGVQKMNNGIITTITAAGIMMGETKIGNADKIYILNNLVSVLPKFKNYISKDLMSTPSAIFTRYRIDDQSKEIQTAFATVKNILDNW